MPAVEDYVRNAVVVRVVDGDTLDVDIDLGFSTWMRRRIRVLGVNCPEMKGATREEGKKARDATARWLDKAKCSVVVRTHLDKIDSFGRVLADVWANGESLGKYLLCNGYAIPFRERKK